MSTRTVGPRGPLRGDLRPAGDKSLTHRGLLLGALARGPWTLARPLEAGDTAATLRVVEALGARVEREPGRWVVHPAARVAEPDQVLDCGNAGTLARLLLGVLAPEPIFACLTGDASLRGRPMRRVVEPLRQLGARVEGRMDGTRLPLGIRGGPLAAGRFDLPVASAQVKSALLLAGRSSGLSLREPGPSRDHTERLLQAVGVELVRDLDGWLTTPAWDRLDPLTFEVPADPSAAAFWWVAAALVPGSAVTTHGVGLNPTRCGALDVLRQMGASIQVEAQDQELEPLGRVSVSGCGLRGTTVAGADTLRALDEIPVLAVAAAFAEGPTRFLDAAELRVKESDRLARVAEGLRALGVQVDEEPAGLTVWGGTPKGPATVDCRGDHRLAMAFAVAGLATPGGVTLLAADEVGTSNPRFFQELDQLTGGG